MNTAKKKKIIRAGRYEQKFISLYFLADLRYTVYLSVFSFLYLEFFFYLYLLYIFYIPPNVVQRNNIY